MLFGNVLFLFYVEVVISYHIAVGKYVYAVSAALQELFNIPILKSILLRLGGIPVDRSGKNNIVNQAAALFGKYDDLNIIIAPEGTRKLVHNWKKGFYYIAMKANVPVVLGFLDYEKKELGFGPVLYLTGNYEEDWKVMEKFYRGIPAKHPDRYNLSK